MQLICNWNSIVKYRLSHTNLVFLLDSSNWKSLFSAGMRECAPVISRLTDPILMAADSVWKHLNTATLIYAWTESNHSPLCCREVYHVNSFALALHRRGAQCHISDGPFAFCLKQFGWCIVWLWGFKNHWIKIWQNRQKSTLSLWSQFVFYCHIAQP